MSASLIDRVRERLAVESGPLRPNVVAAAIRAESGGVLGDTEVLSSLRVLQTELTGAGKNGIRYFLENIIDPNAVIGSDFRMTTIDTKNGDVISGLVLNETPSALTLRTTAEQVVIAKADITARATSEKSLMPEGLLESLSEREQIELLKFLTSN